MYEACRMSGWWISEVAIREDHHHIVVQVPPKWAVGEVVQIFKGRTSRKMRREFPDLEEFLWGDSFWADGYFAETVGETNEEVVKKHIRQRRKNP